MKADEIELAGVGAELVNINLSHLCKYIQCLVTGRGFNTRVIVELRFYHARSLIGLGSESVLFNVRYF